jgi:class 3 adenylate cyclase/tetratricopeptide (TPR) repeat protein
MANEPDRTHRVVDGTLAFLDLSGFTKLTERLARVGRSGPEEISDILDATFGALLGSARDDGADLVKWGGDAVLLLFRGENHARHAVRAAYRMRQTLREVGQTWATAGRVVLRMSVGIHSGRFHFFLVGDPDLHRELIVSGPGASVTAQMEAIAQAGQIVVSDATAELLDPTMLGVPVAGGRVLRSSMRSVPTLTDVSDEVDLGDFPVESLISEPVREHLLSASGSSEHRLAAVGFVQFSGTDELIGEGSGEDAVEAMDEVVRNVQSACSALGVTFLESDINKDGGKFLLVAGAPRSSGEDDDRLISAVRLIVTRQGRLQLRAGANHGRVFAGDFGPAFRRTYSIKGDAINVAARVMGHAEPGTLLATDDVLIRSGGRFDTQQVPPFLVKGKTKPIHASEVGALRAAQGVGGSGDDTFVGREHELNTVRAGLERTRSRQGSLVEVVGEPGMGKSRLIEEILRDCADVLVLHGPSGSYEASTPYYPFRTLIRSILELQLEDPDAKVAERLRNRVDLNAPHLLPWLPLLGLALGIEIPATKETEEADPRFLHTKLEEVVVELLELVLDTPTLLVFENTHLTDDASAGLMARLEKGLDERPWVVLVTRRDLDTGYCPSRGVSQRLDLTPIDTAKALELLVANTGTPLSPAAMEAIIEKAEGNPLFLKALVHAAAHADDDALPDSIEAVLTKEIDRLPPDSRTLLRCAAVLGMRFYESMLREMLAATDSPAAGVDLSSLDGMVEPNGDGRWRFQHALIREAAYAGLPYRLRRRMHRYAGRALEATAADHEDVSERLSLHFSQAGDDARTWTYSRMAGRRAQSQYAYSAAMQFYARAFAAGRSDAVPDHELAEVLEARGDVCDIAGSSRDAVAAYRKARTYRPPASQERAVLLLKEAGLHQRLGAFVTSLRLLSQGRSALSEVDGAEAAATRSRLATRYGFGKYLQGKYAASLRWSELGVVEAKESGDAEALAYAYNTRHVACMHAGVADEENSGLLALELYRKLGDLRMQGHCLNNLAIAAMQEGAWTLSAERLDQAAELFRRVGDTPNEANALYNRADLLIRQRRFSEAEPLLVQAMRAARAADDEELVALAQREHGRALTGLGRTDEAHGRFAQARSTFTELGLPQELVQLDEAAAACRARAGDYDGAIQLATEALERANAEQVDSVLAALHRVRGFAHASRGDLASARADFEAGMDSPDSGDGRCEYALNLLGIAALMQGEDAVEAERLLAQSREILEGLGVVVPPLPTWR